jgi:subtilisin-like proprotein convertase family protein
MHFSRDFGYGLVDVSAAVRLAESWALPAGTMANWQSAAGVSLTASGIVLDNNPAGFTAVANVVGNVRIERMEFDLNLDASNPGQLSATMTSPAGTTITLFDQPLTRNLVNNAPDMEALESTWPATFTIGSTAFLGESSAGNWTLNLTDKVTGIQATYNGLTVRAWGSSLTTDSQFFLTDEFMAVNAALDDTGGIDTINAAACANAVQLSLLAGTKSIVGNGGFTVSSASVIENAIGGLGDDTLTGNSANNVLRGNGGSDTIDGSAGIDTAIYTAARSSYTITKTASGLHVAGTPNVDGNDTLSNIERLQFSDTKIAFDTTLGQSAGNSVLLLGAVLGNSLLQLKKPLIGSVTDLFDQGFSLQVLSGALMRLPIWGALANGGAESASNEQIAGHLLRTVNGMLPDALTLAAGTSAIASETGAAQGTFLSNLAASTANQSQVQLVGLATTGIDFGMST